MSQTHDLSPPRSAALAWSWWPSLTIGLAVAAALAAASVQLGRLLMTMYFGWALLGVLNLAVPAVGAWMAWDRHRRLGLAVIATWGALAGLPVLGWWVATHVEVVGLLDVSLELTHPEVLVWSALAVAALGAALQALATHRDRVPLAAAGRRKTAAVVVALWGLLFLGGPLIGHVGSPVGTGPLLHIANVRPVVTALVLLALAVVIWRDNGVTVVAAVWVITVHGLAQILLGAGNLVTHLTETVPTGAMPVAIAAFLLQVVAVVTLTIVAARLTGPARAEAAPWPADRQISVPDRPTRHRLPAPPRSSARSADP